jgi:quercetin dioxygenase-like cupin family protein
MEAGAAGPEHAVNHEQVWTVLDGELEVTVGGEALAVPAGDTVRIPPAAPRRIAAVAAARALVASRAGVRVTTPDGGTRPLPWAA